MSIIHAFNAEWLLLLKTKPELGLRHQCYFCFRLLYTPCSDCSGTEYIYILLTEVQTDFPAANTVVMLTVNVTSQNDYPVVFFTQYGKSVLFGDPSEPVIVSLSNYVRCLIFKIQ